jgi:LysM repeat protein
MGRLEKQIIIGALALVGVLLTVVVLKGLKPRDGGEPRTTSLIDWEYSLDDRPELVLDSGVSKPDALDEPERTPMPPPTIDPIAPQTPVYVPPVPKPSTAQEPRIYVVQRGEVLSKISERELGSINHIELILDLNPGMNADRLTEGDSILLPPIASLQNRSSRSTSQREMPQGSQLHTVAPGESLWAISMKYYGVESGIDRIVAANRDLLASKETVLRIDWQLVIPQ